MSFSSLITSLTPAASLIVLSDRLELQASELLFHIFRTWIDSPKIKSIVLVLTDSSIETYLDNLETSQEKIQKITFVDCYQNHLEWDSQTENQQQKHEYKYQHCSLVNVENLFSKLFSKTETVTHSALIVDNLSSLILRIANNFSLSSFLQRFAEATKQTFATSLFLLHEDLHTDFEINCLISFCTSFVRVLSPSSPSDTSLISGTLHIVQKRPNGKSLKLKEYYQVTSSHSVKFLSVTEFSKLKSSQSENLESQKESEPFRGLTFNISLTEEQKKAKDAVVLPYVHQGQTQQQQQQQKTSNINNTKDNLGNDEHDRGIIYIDADDDAFQASDPDEDLDI